MRVHRLTCLTIACTAAIAGCKGGGHEVASFCYSTDELGVVRDSVRPDSGYVCVATLHTSSTSQPDSVRPDSFAMMSASAKSGVLQTIKLQVMRRDSLKRR